MGVNVSPPAPHEIEVSVFGPGFGECTVVHLGDGRWIIVDSCADAKTGTPAALRYLASIGVDPCQVELLVATHWHDDHVRGFSDLVEQCPQAGICISSVLTTEEFATAVLAYTGKRLARVTSGVSEMRRVLDMLPGRRAIRGGADKRIMASALTTGSQIEVWTLSPSDDGYGRFLASLARVVSPVVGARKQRVPLVTPNDCSVAVFIRIGCLCILLGADLEEEAPSRGWSAILTSAGRPVERAAFFKVPHHGSRNADHPDVWRSMLTEEPVFAVAPYNRGRKLPTNDDLARLRAYSSNGYLTASPSAKPSKRAGTVGKILSDLDVKVSLIEATTGQVRGRAADGSAVLERVDLFGGATRIA